MCLLIIADRSLPRMDGNFNKEDPVENESNFYAYFLTMVIVVIAGYVLFHNKQKVKQQLQSLRSYILLQKQSESWDI